MNRGASRWIFNYIIRPPVVFLAFIVKPVWLLLGLLDRPLARREQRKLRLDITETMHFLFEERHARIVPNDGVPFPPGFDYAFVTVEIENMLIRFSRGRGELDVQIGSKYHPGNLHELGLVLSLLDEEGEWQRCGFSRLSQVAQALESKMAILHRALGEGIDDRLARRLREIAVDDRIGLRQAEWEINKRLKSRGE